MNATLVQKLVAKNSFAFQVFYISIVNMSSLVTKFFLASVYIRS